MSNSKSTNSGHDQIARLSWKVGSFCSIWSRSKNQWFEGQIEEIKGKLSEEWLIVRYNDNCNKHKQIKSIQRNNENIKPLPKDHILSLHIGSFCSIYSTLSHVWCKGQVIEIFNDKYGEWLTIKYSQNNKIIVTEIQRYSPDLKPCKSETDIDEKPLFNKQLFTEIAQKHTSFYQATTELASKLPFTRQFNHDLSKSVLIHILKQDNTNKIKYKYEGDENNNNNNNINQEQKSESDLDMDDEFANEFANHEIDKSMARPLLSMMNKNKKNKAKRTGHGELIEYKWSEIKRHNKQSDLWLVYANKVFDITSFLRFHPGGIDVILQIAAKTQDVTKVFNKLNHPPITNKIITKHYIGNVSNKTHFQRMSLDLDAMNINTNIWNPKDNNLNINVNEEMNETVMVLRDHYVIQWTDLFTVKIGIIDTQHESLINAMNKIYELQEIKYLMDLLKRWDVHCKTEETLFEYYQFDKNAAAAHLQDHKAIYHQIKDQMTFIRIKYNNQQTKAKELSDFAAKISKRFISHHHEHDIKYVDYLDKAILNDL